MNIKDLLFFNKEGYRMNLSYDEQNQYHFGDIFFDKNSTDTFKTQGIYTFEKVEPTNNTFNAYLDKFQVFNTNGFNFVSKKQSIQLAITNIEIAVEYATYNTKWIYATDIHKYYSKGQWIYVTGLNGFHNTDFDEYNTDLQVRKILAVEVDRILIWTQTANNIALPLFVPGSSYINPLTAIEINESLLGFPPEPAWQETGLTSKLFINKKISVVNNDINGIFTIKDICNEYEKYSFTLLNNLFVPAVGDKLKIDIELKTSNILLFNDSVTFDSIDNSVTFNALANLKVIPNFLKIGDVIQARQKVTPLLLANSAQLTITDIDFDLNKIYVGSALADQTVDCYINLATNVITLEQDILSNNGSLNLPLTYWTLYDKNKDFLNNINGGVDIEYLTNTDDLKITSKFVDDYINITAYRVDISNVTTTYPITADKYKVYVLNVLEEIKTDISIKPDTTIYNKLIDFTVIDNFGLNININGIDYNVDQDVTVAATVADWMTQYSALFSSLGITVTSPAANQLNITTDYPNVPIFCKLNMGDFADYYVKYKEITISDIGSQLLITINDQEYLEAFDTNDATTITNWVNTHIQTLKQLGIIVSNVSNTLHIDLLDIEQSLKISYNLGYLPKSGDNSIVETLFNTGNTGSIITGNEIRCNTGVYNFLDFYSSGQKISIKGATKIAQNQSYNILNVESDSISLSYQGTFWQEGLPVFALNILSDFFIRFPKYGFDGINNKAKLLWSFKNTKINDFFFYDFSGTQLKPYNINFPNYNGPTPLCGPNGDIQLKLNNKPNTDLANISDPTKQQTVFDILEYDLPFVDETLINNIEPDPMQVFIGYNSELENWNKARIYLDLIEDISYTAITDNILNDNVWTFKENYVELINPTTSINFIQMGYLPNQKIEFTYFDYDPINNLKLAKLDNAGITYTIKEVQINKIIFKENVIDEVSYKTVPAIKAPFYDNNGNAVYINRNLSVTMTVIPKTLAQFDIYGESEDEDKRHAINLNNRNLNILKLQDFYIFKDVDINENGIDWIYLNRKRKELIEIYSELFNSLSSYKSVIYAINFFGYNDLSFVEYFQNINPESNKFGKLFNMELLNIFDKTVDGWQFSNLSFENLRNEGYRKTNLFSLNYKITDLEGNFISAYSLDEVRIKLLGLKNWLTENIIPIGTKIIDVNGKYYHPDNYKIRHETYMTKRIQVEEYGSAVNCTAKGYLQPISSGSKTYDISVEFTSTGDIEWYQYTIRTFQLEKWNETSTYLIDTNVWYDGNVWKSVSDVLENNIPGFTNNWILSDIENLESVQILQDYKWDQDNVSFTINELVDPHFIIEVNWHSGYSLTHKQIKSYSVFEDFFTKL